MTEIVTTTYKKKYLLYKSLYLDTIAKGGNSNAYIPSSCNQISYFFDNYTYNFKDKDRCPCIIPVPVMETDPISLDSEGNESYCTPEEFTQYCQTLSGGARQYGEAMQLLGEANGYDSLSGISIAQLNHFIKLVASSKNQLKAFIFDWDRTLTVIEGIYAIKPTVKIMLKDLDLRFITVKEVAEFYFGGKARCQLLKQLWDALREKNIDIWILSSNPSIGEFPLFFLNLLEAVGLHLEADHLAYKGDLTKYEYMEKYL